jgi:hypothetical protein
MFSLVYLIFEHLHPVIILLSLHVATVIYCLAYCMRRCITGSGLPGPVLEKLMEQLRTELATDPPLPGAFVPKKGDLCAAKFTDGEW